MTVRKNLSRRTYTAVVALLLLLGTALPVIASIRADDLMACCRIKGAHGCMLKMKHGGDEKSLRSTASSQCPISSSFVKLHPLSDLSFAPDVTTRLLLLRHITATPTQPVRSLAVRTAGSRAPPLSSL